MTDEETQRMADLTRKLADTAIYYKKRCEELEAKLAKRGVFSPSQPTPQRWRRSSRRQGDSHG